MVAGPDAFSASICAIDCCGGGGGAGGAAGASPDNPGGSVTRPSSGVPAPDLGSEGTATAFELLRENSPMLNSVAYLRSHGRPAHVRWFDPRGRCPPVPQRHPHYAATACLPFISAPASEERL